MGLCRHVHFDSFLKVWDLGEGAEGLEFEGVILKSGCQPACSAKTKVAWIRVRAATCLAPYLSFQQFVQLLDDICFLVLNQPCVYDVFMRKHVTNSRRDDTVTTAISERRFTRSHQSSFVDFRPKMGST